MNKSEFSAPIKKIGANKVLKMHKCLVVLIESTSLEGWNKTSICKSISVCLKVFLLDILHRTRTNKENISNLSKHKQEKAARSRNCAFFCNAIVKKR